MNVEQDIKRRLVVCGDVDEDDLSKEDGINETDSRSGRSISLLRNLDVLDWSLSRLYLTPVAMCLCALRFCFSR